MGVDTQLIERQLIDRCTFHTHKIRHIVHRQIHNSYTQNSYTHNS